tara:strand:+ start:984 stop:4976 length:3993 start_codon:yes stop_codon:yes gene_type:complete
MPKQEYKILEFHGGTNTKFDPRDIADNQNVQSELSIRKPGRLVKEGHAKAIYDKTDLNGHTITDITAASGGFEKGYGMFMFSHDYDMEGDEVDTEFICVNDMNGIDIYDPNQSTEWQADKFLLGSRTAEVKPEYYNVDGALRACDANFSTTDTSADTSAAYTKNDVVLAIDNGSSGNVTIATGSVIQIDQEIMYVTSGGTGQSFTVIRGFANTKITTHADNTNVYYVNVPKYFGHIKQDRLFECASSDSINAWVEDCQTPQPPNNTRKSDGTTGTLASSLGVQSLRVFDVIEGSTSNYPSESEKVVLEFSEGSADVGIIKVEHLGAGTLKLTTSGRGSSATAGHQLKSGMMISIDNVQTTITGLTVTDLSNLSGSYEVLSTPTATTFTIHDEGFSASMYESAVVGDDATYTATVDGWTDIGGDEGTHPGFVKVSNDETDLPGLQSSAAVDSEFWIHITGQTGVPAFNGIHKAYKIDTDDLRFETSSHASVGDVAGTTEIQQLLAVVRPEGSDAINEDLKRKWNFAMSFTYDGPAQEVQESLLTMGNSLLPVTQTDGMTSNLINFEGSELVQDGGDPNPADSNWATVNSDGDGAAQWSSADPPVYQDGEEGSLVNTLTGDAIDAGERYSLTFTVATATLNLAIGGGVASTSSNTAAETFVAAANYAVGTHTVTFQASADRTHLWFTATTDSAGNGTIDDVSLKANGYGSGETSIVVDDGTVFSVGEIIYIGTEQLYISNISTHTLTVSRGYNGSTAAHFGNDSLIYRMTELSSTQTVDWTNFTGVPSCVIKTVYNHGVDEKTWNARINGFKIYMKDVTEGDASKEWRLFSEVNFNKGTYTLFAAGDSELILEQPGADWSSDGQVCTLSTGTELTIKPVDTYLSENMFTEDTIIDAQYKCAEVIGRRMYIGNIRQGGRTYPDRMLRSPVNKFDTFPETNYIDVAVGDGDSITALKSFGDRLLQFKKNKVYVINVSGESEVLEAEYPNAGVSYPSEIVKTNIGIAWINASGLWFFDGKQIKNLTRNILDGALKTSTQQGYIGFDSETNRLIFTGTVGSGLLTVWRIFDLELNALQSNNVGDLFAHSASSANYYTNFVNNSDGDMVFGYVDGSSSTKTELNFYKWDNTPSGGASTVGHTFWKSKDIDFGSPSMKKKVYKIYITYKCTGNGGVKVQYATNGSTSFSDFDESRSTNYLTTGSYGLSNTLGAWAVAELVPSTPLSDINSIQLLIKDFAVGNGTVASSGDTTTIQLASGLGSTNYDEYHLYLYDGPAKYNSRRITAYNTTNQTATVSTLTDNGYGNSPTTATKYILGTMPDDFEINDITIIFRPKRVK